MKRFQFQSSIGVLQQKFFKRVERLHNFFIVLAWQQGCKFGGKMSNSDLSKFPVPTPYHNMKFGCQQFCSYVEMSCAHIFMTQTNPYPSEQTRKTPSKFWPVPSPAHKEDNSAYFASW